MAEAARKPMSIEEFFEWQRRHEDLYELVDGFPRPRWKMMTGASRFHDIIAVNILASLHHQLRGTRCHATTPDIGVRTMAKGLRRPDVTVTCDVPRQDLYTAEDPRVVVEILSPSNEGIDWIRKLEEYRRLEGIAHIVLIDSLAIDATIYTRTAAVWDTTDFDSLNDVIELPAIGCHLRLQDVYQGVPFEQPQ